MGTTDLAMAPTGHANNAGRVPWILLLFFTAAFFIIEHDYKAPEMFQLMMTATSLDEYENINALFQPRAWRQGAGVALGLFGLVVLLTRQRKDYATLDSFGTLLLFFAGWCTLSLLWADEPMLTLRRLILFYLLILGAAGAAGTMNPRHVLLLALVAPILYIGIGIGAEIYGKTFYPWRSYFRFAGTLHPNMQGINCAILFLALFAFWKQARRRRRTLLILLLASFGVLYLTKSRTAAASVIAVLLFLYGLAQDKPRKVALVACFLGLVALFFLVGTPFFTKAPEGVTFRRGGERESFSTLTGRTALWKQLTGFYNERPFLGYGYAGFWNHDRSMEVIEEQGWPISHAHNSYFDTLLESGPVGMVTLVLVFIAGIQRAIRYYRRTGDIAYYFFASLLLFCALDGVLESAPIQRSMLSFFAMIILVYLAFVKAPEPPAAESPA